LRHERKIKVKQNLFLLNQMYELLKQNSKLNAKNYGIFFEKILFA